MSAYSGLVVVLVAVVVFFLMIIQMRFIFYFILFFFNNRECLSLLFLFVRDVSSFACRLGCISPEFVSYTAGANRAKRKGNIVTIHRGGGGRVEAAISSQSRCTTE